jgi:hypothetical protein
MMAAYEEIEIVAKVAVAKMHAPEGTQKMGEECEGGEERGEQKSSAQRRSRGDGQSGRRQKCRLLGAVATGV